MSSDSGFLENLLGSSSSEEEYADVEEVRFRDIIGELETYEEDDEDDKEAEGEDNEPDDTEGKQYHGSATIVRPSDQKILKRALKRIQTEGAKEAKREKVGVIEKPGEHIDNPSILVDDFEKVLNSLHDELLEELQNERMHVEREVLHLGDDSIDHEDSFAYLIAELDKGLLIGGASNIIDNIAGHLGLSEGEREFVRLAYDESMRASGVGDIRGHTLIDDVIVVWDPDKV